MTVPCHPLPASTIQILFQDMARALCDRPEETPAQREVRTTATVRLVLGFEPRDGVEFMFSTVAVGHFSLILDAMRDVFQGQTDSVKARTKSGIVALDRAMLTMVKEFRMARARPVAEEARREAAARTETARATPGAAPRETTLETTLETTRQSPRGSPHGHGWKHVRSGGDFSGRSPAGYRPIIGRSPAGYSPITGRSPAGHRHGGVFSARALPRGRHHRCVAHASACRRRGIGGALRRCSFPGWHGLRWHGLRWHGPGWHGPGWRATGHAGGKFHGVSGSVPRHGGNTGGSAVA